MSGRKLDEGDWAAIIFFAVVGGLGFATLGLGFGLLFMSITKAFGVSLIGLIVGGIAGFFLGHWCAKQ